MTKEEQIALAKRIVQSHNYKVIDNTEENINKAIEVVKRHGYSVDTGSMDRQSKLRSWVRPGASRASFSRERMARRAGSNSLENDDFLNIASRFMPED